MKHSDLVTVVTVTYNAEEVLEETILSVINQTYKNIEYIIIDGASTDKTVDIIKKYEDKISYWISEPDEGIYFAMNKAIEQATGKWINFMNAGDAFFDLDTVRYVMEHKDDEAELIYGNYRKKTAGTIVKAQPKERWLQTMPFCHQTLFTKISLMKTNRFDTKLRLAADHNFILKMHLNNAKFNYIDQTLALFLEGGAAHSNTVEMCLESIKVLLNNGVGVKHIYATSWYKYLIKDKEYMEKFEFSKLFIDELEKKQNEVKALIVLEKKYDQLMQILADISHIQTWKQPLEKIVLYKKLLALYHQFK